MINGVPKLVKTFLCGMEYEEIGIFSIIDIIGVNGIFTATAC